MATTPMLDEVDLIEDDLAEEAIHDGALTLLDILNAENLVDILPRDDVTRIGSRCLEEFEDDLQSRSSGDDTTDDWEKRYDRYLDIAMQVKKVKTFPWAGAANIKFPILTTAAIQFQARAYPAIVDGSNLVKGRVLGPDPQGEKRKRADRIGDHMTYQLLYEMDGWEEDTDRLLLMLPIVGAVFRKTYYDPITRKNVSRMVSGKDFVINYWAASIEAAPRFTQVLRFYPHEVEERTRSGLWAKVAIPATQSDRDDSDTAPVEFLEQHTRIDLDGDGYPEPYIVTLVRETGEVARIVAGFDPDGVTASNDNQSVARIERKLYFTKYGFIPSPDGSFYDIGFGALLDDITAAIDTSLNQLLDAGALQNAQGGFVGSGVNIRSGDIRFRLGEWKRMDVTGGALRDNIVPLNLPGPSAVLFSLLEMLIGAAKEITSVQDILTGAGQGQNTPATTVLAQIEQATKVMTGIFKRIHRSFGQELRILFGLNRDYLDEEAFYALTDAPGQTGRQDYQDQDLDVVPVSDPTMVTDAQKAVRAQALLQFINDPLVNQEAIRRRFLDATGQGDVDELLNVPPPPPDPKVLEAGASLALEKTKVASENRKNNAAAAASLMSAAQTAQMLDLLNDAATLAGAAVRLGTDAADMEDNGEPADRAGPDGGVEGAPADTGLPPVPGGSAIGPDGDMGAGSVDGAGMAAGGGDPGGIAPSQLGLDPALLPGGGQ